MFGFLCSSSACSLLRADSELPHEKAEWVIHDSLLKSNGPHAEPRGKVVLFLHGGAHVRLSPKTHRPTVATISKEFKSRVLCAFTSFVGGSFPIRISRDVAGYRG